MQLYKLLRTSLTTVVTYILHAFQIHKNALTKDNQYIYNTNIYIELHSREKLGAPVHDFQHGWITSKKMGKNVFLSSCTDWSDMAVISTLVTHNTHKVWQKHLAQWYFEYWQWDRLNTLWMANKSTGSTVAATRNAKIKMDLVTAECSRT